MKILSIINGVSDPELYDMVEQYAFLDGFQTCDLHLMLTGKKQETETPVLLFLDYRSLENLSKELLSILNMKFPVAIIPKSRTDMIKGCMETESSFIHLSCPFSRKAFRSISRIYIEKELMETRALCFGQMCIDQSRREITVRGETIRIGGYSYDIFLLLIEHIGEVISREEINRKLPERQRHSTRNVDTHIKQIRKHLQTRDLIKCIRSVGYCIPAEPFYRNMSSSKDAGTGEIKIFGKTDSLRNTN
ncbi:MAG: transcriptional regulator [Lachnospiraceae bacterium]